MDNIRDIFLGIPLGGDAGMHHGCHLGVMDCMPSKHRVRANIAASSALTANFNSLLVSALNMRQDGVALDYFVMLHSDICPEKGWLDKLVTIAEGTQADVLSVVSPIKNELGLTSSGVDTSKWTPRRFTMAELQQMPATFDSTYTLEHFRAPLLINTGLMLIRLADTWITEFPGFNIDNTIYRDANGVFHSFFEPEDWKFSRWAFTNHLRVFNTREIALQHMGQAGYPNQGSWGSLAVDNINLVNGALGAAGLLPK